METIRASKLHRLCDEKLAFTFWKAFQISLLEDSEVAKKRKGFSNFELVAFFLFFGVVSGSLSWSLIKLLYFELLNQNYCSWGAD